MHPELLNESSPLTEAQWQGLALLGDLGNRLGSLLDGPVSGAVTNGLDRLGDLNSRYDLEALGTAVLDLLDALHRAGLLRLVRDNAAFIGDSLEALTPLLARWLDEAAKMPLEETKADIAALFAWLRRLRLVGEFVETQLAGKIADGTVELGDFLQRNDTEPAMREALVLLGRAYRTGLLSEAGEFVELVAGLTEGTSYEAMADGLVHGGSANAASQAAHLLRGGRAVLAAAKQEDVRLGGVGGLLHLLLDKKVQNGLYALSALAFYLQSEEEKKGSEPFSRERKTRPAG